MSLFIFLVTFALVLVLETVGEDALAAFLSGNQLLAVFASALVGLVPNCSASVVITQLYLEGVLGFAPLMAALLTSAGVGYLVLFRTKPSARERRDRGQGCSWLHAFGVRLLAALGMAKAPPGALCRRGRAWRRARAVPRPLCV
ncbi:MAG: putative manganese transporter [Collinsella sp.]